MLYQYMLTERKFILHLKSDHDEIATYNLFDQKMSKLAGVSMFPYSAFWRIDGQGFMKNNCGGIATICAIVILVAISVLKFYEVFKMTTIVATSSSAMNLQPPMTNISTIQNNPAYMPYMIGLGFYQDFFYGSSSTATAEYTVITRASDGTRSIVRTNITLENCTANHFSVLPNVTKKAKQWGMSTWLCLPLNQTYQIGGSYELSSVYKRIQVNITCDRADNFQDCGYVKQYTLNAAVDPTSVNASTYFLSEDTFLVKAQSSLTYSSKVNKHTLVIDNSVLPTPLLSNTTSTDTNVLILQQSTTISQVMQTTLKIEVSGRSVTYNRSYLKLVDALAYIGGIFNSILAVFFFIEGFNRYFFEMRFANQYFKTKQTKTIDFITYIKASLYPMLKGTRFQPTSKEWTDAGKHGQIKLIVNKLLDVIYLNKRIAFLEQAISVIFEPHQLKGLHLMHSMNTQEAEKSFHKHRFRQRLIYFIHKTQKIEQQALGLPQDLESERGQSDKLRASQATNQKNLLKSKSVIDDEKIESDNKMMKGLDELQQSEPKLNKPGATSMRMAMETQLGGTSKYLQGRYEGIINQADQLYKEKYMDHGPEIYMKMREHRKIIKQQVEYIGEMDPEDLKEGQLVDQLQDDLRRLMEEAEDETNKISSTIYKRLDDWLKEELRHVIKQQKEEGKFSKLKKKSKIMKKKDTTKSDK